MDGAQIHPDYARQHLHAEVEPLRGSAILKLQITTDFVCGYSVFNPFRIDERD
jgi:hypothetical protein